MKTEAAKDFAALVPPAKRGKKSTTTVIGEDRMEKATAPTPATPVKEKKAVKATVFTLGEGLLPGKTLVKEGAVGAALYRIVEAAPEAKATLEDILDALEKLEEEGNGLGVKSAHYHNPEKRAGYVNGYVRWLVGNDNLVAK